MANNFYCRTSLIGGGGGALDELDGAGLSDLDFAIVSILNKIYMYTLDDDSAAAEDSPNVISPDTNAGTKRWILQGLTLPSEAGSVLKPTLSFGDGNTGFYEIADNRVAMSFLGLRTFNFEGGFIESTLADGFRLEHENSTATNPVHTFGSDEDTGLGRAGVDALSLIAGGVEGLRVTEVGGIVSTEIFGDLELESLNLISFENATVYFEGNAVFN